MALRLVFWRALRRSPPRGGFERPLWCGAFPVLAGIRAGDQYELLDSNDLGEMALATPALIGDRLILRTANHLYSIRNTPGDKR